MVRRRPILNKKNETEIAAKVEQLLGSPLDALGRILADLVRVSSNLEINKKEFVDDYVYKILERLPSKFDARFEFDMYLISSLMESWSKGPKQCSLAIVSTYHKKWGYEQIPIHQINGDIHNLEFVYIRRNEEGEVPWLLDYPWLIHELAHYLVRQHGQIATQNFNEILDQSLSTLRMRSIADQNTAKLAADKIIADIDKHWRIFPSANGWSRELIVDVISLWLCGPAYIAVYVDDHESIDDAFQVEPTHPPVELRTFALLVASKQLGWQDYLAPLEHLQRNWENNDIAVSRNKYNSLRQKELINNAIKEAFSYCEYLKLPRLRLIDLDRVRQGLLFNLMPEDTVDLIVSAWLVNYEQGVDAYSSWESTILQELM